MKAFLHRSSRRLLARTIVAAAALGAVSAATAAPREWFLGATFDSTSVDIAYGMYDSKTGPSNTGYTVHGGLSVNRYLALDFGLQRNSGVRWSESIAMDPLLPSANRFNVQFDARIAQATVIGTWPIGQVFDLYGRLGIGSYRLDGEQWLTDSSGSSSPRQSTSSDGTGAVVGIGAGARLAKNWRLNVEFETAFVGKAFFGVPATHGLPVEEQNSAYLDSLTLGIERRFGGGNRAQEVR